MKFTKLNILVINLLIFSIICLSEIAAFKIEKEIKEDFTTFRNLKSLSKNKFKKSKITNNQPKDDKVKISHTKVQIFFSELSQKALSQESVCKSEVDVKYSEKEFCFNFNQERVCKYTESFVFHNNKEPAFISIKEFQKSTSNLKLLGIDTELYLSIVYNLIENKFEKDQCIVGLSNNNFKYNDSVAKIINNDPEKELSIIVICQEKDKESELDKFKNEINQMYIKKLPTSLKYFSIKGFPMNKVFKVNFYSEVGNMDHIMEYYLTIKEQGVFISENENCDNTLYTLGFSKIMECAPGKLTEKNKSYIKNNSENNILVDDDHCFELISEYSNTGFSRNAFCFQQDAKEIDYKIMKKLVETTIAKTCILSQSVGFKKVINENKNKLKCAYGSDGKQAQNQNILNDLVRLKNLNQILKALYKNLREWQNDFKVKEAPLFISNNYKNIKQFVENKVQYYSVNKIISIRDPLTKEPLPSYTSTLLQIQEEKFKKQMEEKLKNKMTISLDADTSINTDWNKRSSTNPSIAPISNKEDDDCTQPITPGADPLKDLDNMMSRLKKKEFLKESEKKALEAAKKAVEDAKKQVEEDERKKKEEEEREKKKKEEEEKQKQKEEEEKQKAKDEQGKTILF